MKSGARVFLGEPFPFAKLGYVEGKARERPE
jgi:hypothetical protein